VNFFLGCVGVTQVTRILLYQRRLKNGDLSEVVKEDARELKDSARGVVGEVKAVAREAVN
jgi:mitochondrial pyruvate carrier 2